jgi:hypothetical protein
MAIQIRGNQILNNTITATQIDLSGTFDFSSGTLQAGTPSAGADVATKAYVDGQLPDSFSGGDGISIDTSGDPDVIAVDLATNPGLQFTSNKLDVKVKTESGGSITKDADGIYIADSAISSAKLAGSIANAKLANSTISGKALGTSLDALAAGQGLAIGSAFDGSAAQTMDLNLDGSSLSKSASGVKVANLGVGSAQLADGAVQTAKIGDGQVSAAKLVDDSIGSAKLAITSEWHSITPNGSATAFDLGHTLSGDFAYIMVFRNGIALEQKASSPSGVDEYSVSLNGGTGGVGQVTFGSAPASGENIRAFYIQG